MHTRTIYLESIASEYVAGCKIIAWNIICIGYKFIIFSFLHKCILCRIVESIETVFWILNFSIREICKYYEYELGWILKNCNEQEKFNLIYFIVVNLKLNFF